MKQIDYVIGQIRQLVDNGDCGWEAFHKLDYENEKLKEQIKKLKAQIRRLKSGCKKQG